jgi:hypothetical protein
VKYRPHRGGLAEAMAEMVEVKDKAHLERYLLASAPLWRPFESITIEPYSGADDRIGWDSTWIVMGRWNGKDYPIGFTDGPG